LDAVHKVAEGSVKRYFDSSQRRLIYVDRAATPDFWDGNWAGQFPSRVELLNTTCTQWSRITEEFLKPDDGPVLEGGCGLGLHVAALHNQGYRVMGVDFAENCVSELNRRVPELDIRLGDVRDLAFPENFFAGYWSLGVIEHFWDGYGPIAREMHRVLADGGYLFLAFPYMNQIRRIKAMCRLVPRWNGQDYADFFQFALDHRSVLGDFERLGFTLARACPVLQRQGMNEEAPRIAQALERMYKCESRNVAFRAARRLVHEVASRIQNAFSYSMLLVLCKHG